MKRKQKTIRRKMFETYVAALLVVVVIFITVYMTQTYRIIREQVTGSMVQISNNIAERLDDEVKQISLISGRVTFSKDVRKLFFEKLPESENAAEVYRLTNQLNEILYGIVGPEPGFYHMNIVNLSGYRYAFGQEYNYKSLESENMKKIFWLDETVEKGGKLVISPTRQSVLNEIPEQVVSLSRGFGMMVGGEVNGVVEIQISYDKLEELIVSTAYLDSAVTQQRTVIVLDGNGNLVYPIGLEEDQLEHYQTVSASVEKEDGGRDTVKNTVSGEIEHIFSSRGDESGWQVLLVVPDSTLSSPLQNFIWQILFLSVLMLVGVGIFSTKVSRVYSGPIRKLYSSVKELTLEDISSDYEMQIKSGVDELEQLNKVFNKMIVRLRESLDEVVESRNMEMHSRMLALQAQMNPHFLYNTLTVISIMADNDEKENVQWACRNLSDMLEYISSEALHLVCVKEEMTHTKNYMELIQMRYMDDIEFVIDMPQEMEEINIPKLVIQPLVENAVKYATVTQPVWRIQLSAWTEENKWFVCVKDNGKGFSKRALQELLEKRTEIEETEKIPELTLNGMGILNIYLRMRFYYKEEAVFMVENLPDQGAKVMIGGLIEKTDTVL